MNYTLTQFETESNDYINLDLAVDSIIITDAREIIDSGVIKMPLIRTLDNIKHNPTLEAPHKRIITNEIDKQCIGYEDAATVSVTLLQGYQEFSPSTFTKPEKESAFIKLKLEFLFDDGRIIQSTTNSNYYIHPSFSSSSHFERLYAIALKAAIHKGLKKVKEKYDSIN